MRMRGNLVFAPTFVYYFPVRALTIDVVCAPTKTLRAPATCVACALIRRKYANSICIFSPRFGPIVKWHYAAFALLRRESDSPWVHDIGN